MFVLNVCRALCAWKIPKSVFINIFTIKRLGQSTRDKNPKGGLLNR